MRQPTRLMAITCSVLLSVSLASIASGEASDPKNVAEFAHRAMEDGASIHVYASSNDFFGHGRGDVYDTSMDLVVVRILDTGILVKGGLSERYPWHLFIPFDSVVLVRAHYSSLSEADYSELLARVPDEHRSEFLERYADLEQQVATGETPKLAELSLLLQQ